MNSPDAEAGYLALFPPGYEWPNRFIPRATLPLPGYRPVAHAHKVRAPLLVQVMSARRRDPARARHARSPSGPRAGS